MKRTLITVGNKALQKFLTLLKEDLDHIAPLRLNEYKDEADRIPVTSQLLRSALESQLDSFESSNLSIFEENIRVYKITQQAGIIRVDTARNKLKRDIGAHEDMKMELHADMVGDWNRDILNKYTNPVKQRVIDYSIDIVWKLNDALLDSKRSYFANARGENYEKDKVGHTFDGIVKRGTKP